MVTCIIFFTVIFPSEGALEGRAFHGSVQLRLHLPNVPHAGRRGAGVGAKGVRADRGGGGGRLHHGRLVLQRHQVLLAAVRACAAEHS